MSRESGYYWVKVEGGKRWVIARYYPLERFWSRSGMPSEWHDKDFIEIDPNRILMPDEKGDSDFVQKVSSLVQAFKEQELPDAETPFHFDAEGWSAMKCFLKFIESTAHE